MHSLTISALQTDWSHLVSLYLYQIHQTWWGNDTIDLPFLLSWLDCLWLSFSLSHVHTFGVPHKEWCISAAWDVCARIDTLLAPLFNWFSFMLPRAWLACHLAFKSIISVMTKNLTALCYTRRTEFGVRIDCLRLERLGLFGLNLLRAWSLCHSVTD